MIDTLKNPRLMIAAAGLAAALTAGAAAQPMVLLQDGFGDGDRDNDGVPEGPVEDAADIGVPWYLGTGTSNVLVGVVDDGAGLGSGNAIELLSDISSTRALVATFPEVTLADGDRISVRFDVRITENPIDPFQDLDPMDGMPDDENGDGVVDGEDANTDRRFRAGLWSTVGAQNIIMMDGETDPISGDSITDVWTGYRINIDAGDGPLSGNNDVLAVFPDNPDGGIIGGTSSGGIRASDDNADAFLANEPATLELVLERNGDQMDVIGRIDIPSRGSGGVEVVQTGGTSGTQIDDAGLPFSFNAVGFGHSTAALDFVVDNVVVTFTPNQDVFPTSDGFGDGDVNNDGVTDVPPMDLDDIGFPWVRGAAQGDYTISGVVDDGAGGIGNGNALRAVTLSTGTRAITTNINPIELMNPGESARFAFTIRGDTVVQAGDRRLRFGIFNDAGTPTNEDDEMVDDDFGYMAQVDTNSAGTEVGGNDVVSLRTDLPGDFLGGSSSANEQRSFGANGDDAAFVFDLEPQRFELIVTRRFDEALGFDVADVSLFSDGTLVASGTDEAALNDPVLPAPFQEDGLFRFNQIAIGTTSILAGYVVDDVEVEFIPAPIVADIFFDGFGDGDRDNDGSLDGPLEDADDIGYAFVESRGTGDFDLSIVDDSAGIGDGNALNITLTRDTTRLASAPIPSITIDDLGDSVTFAFDLRVLSFGTPNNQGFRFGIQNDGGTPILEDGGGQTDDDFGYEARLDVGASSDSTATVRGDLANGLLAGSTRALGGTSDDPVFALDDTDTRRIEFTVTRVFDADFGGETNEIVLTIDGVEATDGLDTGGGDGDTPLATTFNQIAFGLSGVDAIDFLVDNITVSTNTIPCPGNIDLDGDGGFTVLDLLLFLADFDAGMLDADFNGDGILTSDDVVELLEASRGGGC